MHDQSLFQDIDTQVQLLDQAYLFLEVLTKAKSGERENSVTLADIITDD